jgi:HAD superfamily hydrolase (TIGR01484 family)
MFSDVLLTVDYDRTLTAPDSTIPERNLKAIRWFMENGGAFTVNTGRSLPMAQAFKDKVPVNAPLLIYNGGAAYDLEREKIIFMQEIQMDMWKTVHELLELFPDLTVEVQALDKHYDFLPNPAWDAFSGNNCAYATATDGQDLGPFLKFTLYGTISDVTVAQFYSGTQDELRRMDEAEKLINEIYGDKVAVARSCPRIIDVQANGVNKAVSARRLQKELGRKILVCVGDAENDVTMLDGADYAFVPADAVLKERYENVCKCADGAVADVIYEKIPSILNLALDKRE